MQVLLFIDTYRRSFESSDMKSGLWDDMTLYLYLAIIVISLFVGYIQESQKHHLNNLSYKRTLFVFLGLFLTCFLGLRGVNVGADTNNYIMSVSDNTSMMESGGMEIGFMLVCKLLGFLFSSGHVSIFVFSAVTIFFVMATLWRYRNVINLFFAIGFFVGVYYFQALNLLRIYLVAAILLWCFHYILEGRIRKYILCVLLASLFHMSALVMLLPIVFYKVYKKSPPLAVGMLFSAVVLVVSIASHFSDYLTIARYAHYGELNEYEGGFGIMLLVDYLPGLFLIWYIKKYKIHGIWSDMLVSFTLVAIFIRSVAYYISIAGRLGTHFLIVYAILVPYFLNEMRMNRRKEYYPFVLFVFAFLLFKIDLYFRDYLATDGIMPYNFLWND